MIGNNEAHRRLFATAIALIAAGGLIVQFAAELERNGSFAANLWVLVRFFTILANLLVAIVFGRIAFGSRASEQPRLLAGTVFSIMLVGVIYVFLLHGLLELSGGARLANFLLHIVTPILAPLYWLAFARKGALRYRDPPVWAVFPATYAVYALARGAFDGRYAYPFIDVGQIGWVQAGVNCLLIGIGFLAAGCAFVWLDHRLGGSDPNRRV